MDVSLYIPLSDFVPTAFPLLLGCRIYGSVPLTDMDGLFVALTENATIRQQALLLGDLKGVDVVNATLGSQIFSFSNYGFYGRGHFFYVDPDGVRWKDYGLDVGYYSVYIPVFGYDRKFIQTLEIFANLPDLAYEVGSYYHMERMVKIFGIVKGHTFWGHPPIIPLVWVSVEADGYIEYSFDGDYALHIPETSFTVTYSAPGYETQTRTASTNDQIEFIVNLEQTGEPFP